MPGFDRKELRGKLALAITANFKNYYTRDEAAVEEISGVAFIFNQKFFKVGMLLRVVYYDLHRHCVVIKYMIHLLLSVYVCDEVERFGFSTFVH